MMVNHRWSGWPGAWCLDCGMEDQVEIAIADGVYDPCAVVWTDLKRKEACIAAMKECPEPGSKRCDPYARGSEKKSGSSTDES